MSTINVTGMQGTNLLRAAHGLRDFPAEIGPHKFSTGMRAKFKEGLRQLRKAVRRASPILTEEDLLYFGPKKLWDQKHASEEQVKQGLDEIFYEIKKSEAKTLSEIELTGRAEQGICALLLLWMHPDSKMQLTVGQCDDLAWPLIDQLHLGQWIAKSTGLDNGDSFEITKDGEEPTPTGLKLEKAEKKVEKED